VGADEEADLEPLEGDGGAEEALPSPSISSKSCSNSAIAASSSSVCVGSDSPAASRA